MKKGRKSSRRGRLRLWLTAALLIGLAGGFSLGMLFAVQAPDQAGPLTNAAARSGDFLRQRLQWHGFSFSMPDWFSSAPAQDPAAVRVFFAPSDTPEVSEVETALLEMLHTAGKRIVCAFYDFERERVAQVLIEKHAAGVPVSIVSDSDYKNRPGIRRCIQAGIPVVFDERNALMHHKFCVVDDQFVWTGSTNITDNCLFRNNNNSVLIASKEMAVNFTTEFEEMFLHRRFGANSPANTPRPVLTVAGIPMECWFAPEDEVEKRVVKHLQSATRQIDFMAFVLTSEPIAQAMAERLNRGTRVRGLLESRSAASPHSRHDGLRKLGAEIHTDNHPRTLHHKVIIVDESLVMTGSYNFSANADKRNDENLMVIHHPDIARRYLEELEGLIAESAMNSKF